MSNELKPCPFCGSADLTIDDCSDPQQDGTMIFCCKCGGNVKGWGAGCSHRARKLWNTRTADTRADALAGLLREIRWDMGDIDGLPQDEYNCLMRRIDAALANNP